MLTIADQSFLNAARQLRSLRSVVYKKPPEVNATSNLVDTVTPAAPPSARTHNQEMNERGNKTEVYPIEKKEVILQPSIFQARMKVKHASTSLRDFRKCCLKSTCETSSFVPFFLNRTYGASLHHLENQGKAQLRSLQPRVKGG